MSRMNFTQPIPTLRRDGHAVVILDQTRLPHRVETCRLETLQAACDAIAHMRVRGAPLIGGTAAYGVALALRESTDDAWLAQALQRLSATRPTAVNLHWALGRMRERLAPLPAAERLAAAWAEAEAIQQEDADTCARIGEHGLALLRAHHADATRPLRIMTHCNAGWLATMGAGTALAPVYAAQALGLPLMVWVSETRPRNQGLLTAWELREAGVAHALVADNAAAVLMASGEVDMVITGADRIAANGDTANKVGTCLKALAAVDRGIPFYIAAPRSTVDFDCPNGEAIPIETRSADELLEIDGLDVHGQPARLRLAPADTRVANPAFDVTPARLISGIITEFGVLAPDALHTLRHAAAPR